MKEFLEGIDKDISRCDNILKENNYLEIVIGVEELVDKYKITFWDIEKQIIEAENELCMLIEELDGNEYDMKGLSEFQSLLRGE